MKWFERYIINPDTVLLTAVNDHKGRVFSKIIEGEKSFNVTMRPMVLIDSSLNYYCSSLKGAWEGSRSILGDINMLPIIINSQLDIFWFPCSSPNLPECLWFALEHVVKTDKVGIYQTKVQLSFGHTIIVDMKKRRFDTKLQRAAQLRYAHTKRLKEPRFFIQGSDKRIQEIKEPGKGYHNLDNNKEDENQTDS